MHPGYDDGGDATPATAYICTIVLSDIGCSCPCRHWFGFTLQGQRQGLLGYSS